MVKDYKGDAAASGRRGVRSEPANLDARTQRFTLPNGMKVALLPKKTRGEAVNFALALHFARREIGVRQAGRRRACTGAMLMRGTDEADRARRSTTRSTSCAPRSASAASETGASASGQTYRARSLPDTLRLVAEVLREPAFPPAELEKLKRERATALEDSRTDPQRSRRARCAGKAIRIRRATRATRRRSTKSIADNKAVTPDEVKRVPQPVLRREQRGARDRRRLRSGRDARARHRALRRLEEPGALRARARSVACRTSPRRCSSKSPTRPTRS